MFFSKQLLLLLAVFFGGIPGLTKSAFGDLFGRLLEDPVLNGGWKGAKSQRWSVFSFTPAFGKSVGCLAR